MSPAPSALIDGNILEATVAPFSLPFIYIFHHYLNPSGFVGIYFTLSQYYCYLPCCPSTSEQQIIL